MNVSPLLLRARGALSAAILVSTCTVFAPIRATAQRGMPTGANYTDDMPSVEKVKATIQGSDPIDTAARQVAVFDELVSYIDRVHTNRDVRSPMLPAEGKLWGDYRGASAQIAQDFTKGRPAADAQRFSQLEGHYSFDSDFMNAWPKQLIQGQANAAVQNANAGLAASSKRMYDQQMQDLKTAQQAQQQAATVNGQPTTMSNDPTAVAVRRCLELGGDSLACVGKGFTGGLMDMITGGTGLESITGPGRAGVVLSGLYGRTGVTNVSFSGDFGNLGSCGVLVNDDYSYTLNKSATSLKITLATSPSPVTLTMRSDGSLVGPGLVTINGRIITGYEVVTHYKNGAVTGTDRTPIYGPKTDRCTIGMLAAPPPAAPSDNSGSSQVGGMLGALMNTMATIAPASLPGLRMEGKYGSSGLQLDFAGDAVILDCGAAHVKAPYTVENAAAALVVHVKNSGGPFDLVVSSDNTLRGSGSTTVNGRLVTGMDGDNVTYAPRSETCQIASYTPKMGSSATTTVAANASPGTAPAAAVPATTAKATGPISATTASTGSMTLAITSSFPIAKNPLAGAIVKLMTDRFDNVLRKTGAPIPAGTTPGHALAAYVQACPPPGGCPGPAQIMHPYYVGTATFDANGSATIHADVPAGNYYILCTAAGTTGGLVWDMPVTLRAGQNNSIQLTATNAELVK